MQRTSKSSSHEAGSNASEVTRNRLINKSGFPVLAKAKEARLEHSQPFSDIPTGQRNRDYEANPLSPAIERPSKRARPNVENGQGESGNLLNSPTQSTSQSSMPDANVWQSVPSVEVTITSDAEPNTSEIGGVEVSTDVSNSMDASCNSESTDREEIFQSPDAKSSQSGMRLFSSIGVLEFLERDERPTFVIDVANPINHNPGCQLQILFANASLRAQETVLEMVRGRVGLESPGIAVTDDFPEFKAWALSFVKDQKALDVSLPSFIYGGITWKCSTVRKRIRIISSTGFGPPTAYGPLSSAGARSISSTIADRVRSTPETWHALSKSALDIPERSDYFGNATVAAKANQSSSHLISPGRAAVNVADDIGTLSISPDIAEHSTLDWTKVSMTGFSRHLQFTQNIDWGATPLGPIGTWDYDLRAVYNLIMRSPNPAAMYWGDEFTVIYNEAYVLIAGQKHPGLMVSARCMHWSPRCT